MTQPIGRLVITRRFHESFLLRLDPRVDGTLRARDLFGSPVRITILPAHQRHRNQVKVLTEADKRISIAREELGLTEPDHGSGIQEPAINVNLAEIFLDTARGELPEAMFHRLLRMAQYELSEMTDHG